MESFCSPACSQNKSSWTKFPLNSFDFWDKNEWMRPEYILINFAKLTLASISTLLMALWAKYTGYNITFILVDTLKWLSHFKNDLKNVLGACFENTCHLYCFINGKLLFFKGMILKETWRLRNAWKTERVHMIVVSWVTALCSDAKRQCLGLVSKDPGPPSQQFDSQCFTIEKSHSSYKSIFADSHQC